MKEKTVKNTGHLCSVFCPDCGRVTDKISFNLLREAKRTEVICPVCSGTTVIEYDGKKATVYHIPVIISSGYTMSGKAKKKDK